MGGRTAADAAQTKRRVGVAIDRRATMIGGTNKGKDRTGQDKTERERWRWRWRRDGADKERQRTKRAPARVFIDSQDSTAKRSKGHPFAAALLKGNVWKLDGGWRPILVKQMLRRTSYLLGGLPR